MAVLGKPSGPQAALLAANWETVVVMLDADAARESQALFDNLRQTRKVVRVRLPDVKDPCDLGTNDLRGLVCAAAARQGVTLTKREAAPKGA